MQLQSAADEFGTASAEKAAENIQIFNNTDYTVTANTAIASPPKYYPDYMISKERKGYMTNQDWFSSKDIEAVTDENYF